MKGVNESWSESRFAMQNKLVSCVIDVVMSEDRIASSQDEARETRRASRVRVRCLIPPFLMLYWAGGTGERVSWRRRWWGRCPGLFTPSGGSLDFRGRGGRGIEIGVQGFRHNITNNG